MLLRKPLICDKNVSNYLNAQIIVVRDLINKSQVLLNNINSINDYKILINTYRNLDQDINITQQGINICNLALKAYSDIDAYNYYIKAISSYKEHLRNKDYLQNVQHLSEQSQYLLERK